MLFIFTFIALSFGATYEKGKLYFEPGTVDKDGIVTIDIGDAKAIEELKYKEIKLALYKPLVAGTKVEDAKFSPVANDEAEFNDLKTRQAPYGDSFQCGPIGSSYSSGLYGLLGFKVKAALKENISPSITYLIKNGPTGIGYIKDGKEIPSELQTEFKNASIAQTCAGESIIYATYTINRGGTVDSVCIPNTAIPTDITKCADGETVPKIYLKNSQIGRFYTSDAATVKQLLLRFGVVQVGLNIIIGWDGNNWIIAERGLSEYSWSTLTIDSTATNFEGRVIIADSDEMIDCNAKPKDPECSSSDTRTVLGLILAALIVPTLAFL